MPRRRPSLLQPALDGLRAPATEADVARPIREYLERCGLRVFRADVYTGGYGRGRRTAATGLTDFFGILPGGRWWAVEVKHPRARPRPNEAKQHEVIAHLRAQGALVVVARSVEDVAAVISPATIHTDSAGSRLDGAPSREIANGGSGAPR